MLFKTSISDENRTMSYIDIPDLYGPKYKLVGNSFPHVKSDSRCEICKEDTSHWLHVMETYYLVLVCSQCGFYQKYSENDDYDDGV